MRKQSIFLVLAMILVSCNSPLSTTATSTQATSSGIEPTWKTYTNAKAGFSIEYPANWQEEDLPDENAGQLHHMALTGPEGGVELSWGSGLGGACPEGYQPLALAKGSWPACHSQREDGTDLWSLASQPLGSASFGGLIYTNDTTAESRALVLKVISTLSFP